jgi:N utilization substance protein B
MLGRRNLRIKVMQELYSWEIDNDIPVHKLEGHLTSQIAKSKVLYLTNLLYLVEVCNYSMVDKAKRLAKYIKTEEDINASTTIAANVLVQNLQQDPQFVALVKKEGVRNYISDDLVKSLFVEFSGKQKYKEYSAIDRPTLEQDKDIFSFLIKKVFDVNKDLEAHLQEIFINYDDDNALLLHVLGKYVDVFNPAKEDNFFPNNKDWEEEQQFARDLLSRTIHNNDELIAMIEPKLKNWDMDRVALLDLILMKMAVCELKFFPNIPIKVSINEYIDISKFYSTPKSKDFVNGVLDKVKNEMQEKGEIKKFGRGLME